MPGPGGCGPSPIPAPAASRPSPTCRPWPTPCLPGFAAYEWNGVFAPAGVPEPVVQALSTGLNAAIRDPGVAERLAGLNVETVPNSPAEFATFLEAEMDKWGRLVREAGIRPD
jgi:tripartite-type tricarboxylate transporter receptor subunit TctC